MGKLIKHDVMLTLNWLEQEKLFVSRFPSGNLKIILLFLSLSLPRYCSHEEEVPFPSLSEITRV